jgi:23S rRNA (guanosine2251-2'-O)-methyltransferase
MRTLRIIAHNLRSTHNVGSLFRTAEGLGVDAIFLTGYTPYPSMGREDERLPHLQRKIENDIHKTALGAEVLVPWHREANVSTAIEACRKEGFTIIALEQTSDSLELPDFEPTDKLAIVLGSEVEGLEPEVVELCDAAIEIPMFGRKESFNVVQAAAMALYHCRFA